MDRFEFAMISIEQVTAVQRLLKVADELLVQHNNDLLADLERTGADRLQSSISSWRAAYLRSVHAFMDRVTAIVNAAQKQEPTAECAPMKAVHLAQVSVDGIHWRVVANEVLLGAISSMAPNDNLLDLLNAWSAEQNEITDRLVAISEAVEAGRPLGQLLN